MNSEYISAHEIAVMREQVKIYKKANSDNIERYNRLKKDVMIFCTITASAILISLFTVFGG